MAQGLSQTQKLQACEDLGDRASGRTAVLELADRRFRATTRDPEPPISGIKASVFHLRYPEKKIFYSLDKGTMLRKKKDTVRLDANERRASVIKNGNCNHLPLKQTLSSPVAITA